MRQLITVRAHAIDEPRLVGVLGTSHLRDSRTLEHDCLGDGLMEDISMLLAIHVDLNTMQQDPEERVAINLHTNAELVGQLTSGLRVLLCDSDLEVEGVLEYDEERRRWCAARLGHAAGYRVTASKTLSQHATHRCEATATYQAICAPTSRYEVEGRGDHRLLT